MRDYLDNPILNTDSYKPSHWLQYPRNTDGTFFYGSSRGGLHDRTVFFGLQYIINEYLTTPITMEQIDEAEEILTQHGVPFNRAGWELIVKEHGGYLPLVVYSVPEGSIVTTHNALFTVEVTDPRLFWLPSYFETLLLRVWYPTTVATISWDIKQSIREALEQTSDDPEGQLPFKLHDFGARGASSAETAAIGGAAHIVNFMGSDTLSGILMLRKHYFAKMPAFSIPAAEHSTITSWGRENEVEAYRNMLKVYGKPNALLAVVSDSYDIYNAITNLWGKELKQEVIDSGAIVVVRPDSGDPVEVVSKCLDLLASAFGFTVNSKGYTVLNNVRLIQGDGVNPTSIRAILKRVVASGYSVDNIAFGMGGALLQKCDRDTQKFAFKCSATRINGTWHDTYKDPVDDKGKTSLKGRLRLFRHREYGTYKTFRLEDWAKIPAGYEDAMRLVYQNGTCYFEPLDVIRERTLGK